MYVSLSLSLTGRHGRMDGWWAKAFEESGSKGNDEMISLGWKKERGRRMRSGCSHRRKWLVQRRQRQLQLSYPSVRNWYPSFHSPLFQPKDRITQVQLFRVRVCVCFFLLFSNSVIQTAVVTGKRDSLLPLSYDNAICRLCPSGEQDDWETSVTDISFCTVSCVLECLW